VIFLFTFLQGFNVLTTKIAGVFVACGLLIGCDSIEPKPDSYPLEGTWVSACISDDQDTDDLLDDTYIVETRVFTEDDVTISFQAYETIGCITESSSAEETGTYELSDTTTTTESGYEVNTLTMVIDETLIRDSYTIEDIVLIEQDYLYTGLETEDDSTPTEINLDYHLEKQEEE